MLKQALTLATLTLSISANSATIIHNGYTLDTTTNIVNGGGLEWLQWDETIKDSIAVAVGKHSASGWRLASTYEMAALFNAFDFGITFSGGEDFTQSVVIPWSSSESESTNKFTELFGITEAVYGPNPGWEVVRGDDGYRSSVFFGEDENNNGKYNLAYVFDDYSLISNTGSLVYTDGIATIYEEYILVTDSHPFVGIAMVRASAVPTPATAWLFSFALLGLTGIARRKIWGVRAL